MYDLSENITSNIYAISSSWKQMEEKIKTIGTPKDSASFRESLHLTQSKCNQIISQTTKDLHRLTSIVRRGDKQQKLQVDRLKTSFSEAVQTYSKIQKQIAEKRKCHPITTPSEIAQSDDSEPSAAEREQQMMIEQKRIMQDLEFDQGLLIEREQRFKMIEDDIVDVAQIMKELAAMAYEQNEPISESRSRCFYHDMGGGFFSDTFSDSSE
ncbi:hypothetical protein AAG570_002848 [Ranatra chinensis]|uniref:Syntaxin N-terminal domain-containing protein n=1 Tax=Ranatra chinensis TaxID=642074 RepID=A0ABD0YHH2_9HEMI